MVEDRGAVTGSKDRDLRLQSARKKLKNYRAKQAQVEKAKRQSTISNASSNVSSSSISISPSRLVGSVLNEAFQDSQAVMSDRNSMGSFDKRHSRTISRTGAGHARGHSRAGSISLSQSALVGGMAAAAAAAATNHGNPIKHNASLSSSRPLSAHFANISHSHTRGHSRSGSKSLSAKAYRPSSLVPNAVLPSHEEGANDGWRDQDAPLAEDSFKTPTMRDCSSFADMDATPQQRQMSAAPITTITLATPTAPPSSSSSANTHARRPSRHSRKGSVSTRRESMELMGGLMDSASVNSRHSRRISSHRWSGLQSASVLFGGAPDLMMADKRRDFDGESSEDEGGDRLTALEKLEGKRKSESKQSSVQLPSFDDVHGDEAMDKRASLNLLEANVQSTSSERPPISVVAATAGARVQTGVESSNEEGLGTLMEEEEEDEDAASSPVKERGSIDLINEEEKRLRKEAEMEVIKRTRRGSLTPRPLKLKSRPASLFVAPRSHLHPSLPTLEAEEEGARSVDTDCPPSDRHTPSSWTVDSTEDQVKASQAFDSMPRPLAALTPSRETKRAWRSSMPLATPPPSSLSSSPLTSASASNPRQGMRALRLGTNLTTSTSTPSGMQAKHKNHTDSTSSMTSSASNSSTTFSKRGSLLYNISPITTMTASRDEPSPLAKKRGSLLYKPSALDGPSSASAVELSTTSSPSLSVSSPAPPSAPTGGVPMGLFEELKSKHQRDVRLLDEARTRAARLEGEMAIEAERTAREYGELERWSAEEKRALGQRIEHLEASIVEVVQVREAQERDSVEEKERAEEVERILRTEYEDVEAERDMLREDVEGWRMRCSDLEKSLRGERQGMEELKRSKMASKLRIKELITKMQEHGVDVERKSVDEEELSTDLVALLRSPGLGPSSPLLGSTREVSMSPSVAEMHQMAPPQAVQLLKEMRQQIFNLAGSLEHERKQHLLAKQESEELKADVARLTTNVRDDSMVDTTMTTMDSHFFSPEKVRTNGPPPTESTPPQAVVSSDRRTMSSSGGSGKKKRNHVFAYDSSMESGSGGNSLGGGSVTTNQTSEFHHEDGEEKRSDEDFVAQVEADLVGLGMGGLDTLKEEEEASFELEESRHTPLPRIEGMEEEQEASRLSLDIESGRMVSDEDSVAPSTPALDHNHCNVASIAPPVPAVPLEHSAGLRSGSTASSIESQGPVSPIAPTTASSQDTVTTPLVHEDLYDDRYEDEVASKQQPRPEFIREWSFERATAATRARKNSTRARAPVVTARKPKNRNMSIEDFFGIMTLDENQKLPPLPTPEEALEMPPLFIEESYQSGYGPRMGDLAYGSARFPSQIRPPVPRGSMMYANSNGSDRSSSMSSRHSSNHQSSNQSQTAVDLAGPASAGSMFSRVASLTSAFSGLSGYLIGPSTAPGAGMAVHAAAAANKVCSTDNEYDARNPSISWAVTRREEEMA